MSTTQLEGFTLVFPDVHGDILALFTLIQKAQLITSNRINKVVGLGDLIDRGSNSCNLMKFAVNLHNSLNLSVDSVEFLWGNHEALMYKSLHTRDQNIVVCWFENGGVQTLASFCAEDGFPCAKPFFDEFRALLCSEMQSVEVFRQKIARITRKHNNIIIAMFNFLLGLDFVVSFFERLKMFIKHDADLFVHGGFSPDFLRPYVKQTWIDDLSVEFDRACALAIQRNFTEFDRFAIPSSSSKPTSPNWYGRSQFLALSADDMACLTDYYRSAGVQRVFMGHSPVAQPDLIVDSGVHYYYLDVGMTNALRSYYSSFCVLLTKKLSEPLVLTKEGDKFVNMLSLQGFS